MKSNLKKLVALSSGAFLLVSLSACGGPDLPTPKANPEQAVLAVNPTNLPKVITGFTTTITQADKDKNKDLLATRAVGPALKMRTALYQLADKSDYSVTPFPAGSESTTVSLSKNWPRIIFNITRPDDKNQKYLEILTQDGPQAGFKISQWMRLLPGSTFPATAVAGKGSKIVDQKESKKLVLSPEQAISKWPTAIGKKNSAEAKFFVENDFSKGLAEEPTKLQEAIKGSGAKLSTELKVVKDRYASVSLELPDGGVLTSATYQYNFKVTDVKSNKPLVFADALGKLLGDNGKIKSSASWTKTITVLFLIPKSDSKAKIQVLAAENIITDTAK